MIAMTFHAVAAGSTSCAVASEASLDRRDQHVAGRGAVLSWMAFGAAQKAMAVVAELTVCQPAPRDFRRHDLPPRFTGFDGVAEPAAARTLKEYLAGSIHLIPHPFPFWLGDRFRHRPTRHSPGPTTARR